MAGIGFRLRELALRDTAWSRVQVYCYSVFISSGPWIVMVANLFILSVWNPASIHDADRTLLFTLIVHAMAFSYVGVGILSLAFTRHLADETYLNRDDSLLPSLNGFLLVTLSVALAAAVWYLWDRPIALELKVYAAALFLALCVLWIVMIYLSSLRDYRAITAAFAAGALVGWAAIILHGGSGHLAARLLGFTVGQLMTAGFLARRLFKELASREAIRFDFARSTVRRPRLILIGVFYSLGLWADKFVYWWSELGAASGGLRLCPYYDVPLFLAQMTMIPTLAIFLVHIETHFFDQYRMFYRVVIQKGSLQEIEESKAGLHRALREGLSMVVKYQGGISLAMIALAGPLAPLLRLDPLQIPLFRVALLGAFLHCLLHVTLIFLFYFDLQDEALWTSAVFLAGVAGGSWISLRWGTAGAGLGYFSGCLMGLIVSYWGLDRFSRNVEFHTFARQPMPVARVDSRE